MRPARPLSHLRRKDIKRTWKIHLVFSVPALTVISILHAGSVLVFSNPTAGDGLVTQRLKRARSFSSAALSVCLCVPPSRHHTNPVGTEWRWKMDPAEKILQDALEKHQNMIRQFRGWLRRVCTVSFPSQFHLLICATAAASPPGRRSHFARSPPPKLLCTRSRNGLFVLLSAVWLNLFVGCIAPWLCRLINQLWTRTHTTHTQTKWSHLVVRSHQRLP